MGRRLVLEALAGLLALAPSARGSGKAAEAPGSRQDQRRAHRDHPGPGLHPATLTVQAGATVTWVWNDGAVAHDVDGPGFRSKVISEGAFRHRFDQPGSYQCLCTLHPNMTGVIEVTH